MFYRVERVMVNVRSATYHLALVIDILNGHKNKNGG